MQTPADELIHSLSPEEVNAIENYRRSRHTAVLAILFSDIVNSTFAVEKYGETAFAKIRHLHDELFRSIIPRDGAGVIVKEIGDAFLCVFAEPSTAVQRSVEFQNAITANRAHLSIKDYHLTVRIGIHLGQVAIENNLAPDIFGKHVNRAARIQSIAQGGQVLTSQSIWENAAGWLQENSKENIQSICYGSTRLKGISEKLKIYGFYNGNQTPPPTPEIFKKQQKRKGLLSIAILLLVILTGYFIYSSYSKLATNSNLVNTDKVPKTFYLQFNLSELSKKNNTSEEYIHFVRDTNALIDRMTSVLLSVIYPDSLVTLQDAKNYFNRQGQFFNGIPPENFDAAGDSLGVSRWASIKVKCDKSDAKDSIVFEINAYNRIADSHNTDPIWAEEVILKVLKF
ncbi:MAG: adenylate/guanylate cyclase domain-containing protein [Bacteroidetes bacterium]|nr:adenylate/guanylate cyclase domain-containing protein [Bacteroidota bacterium]